MFADDVQAVVAETLLADNFDANETVGNSPSRMGGDHTRGHPVTLVVNVRPWKPR